MLRRTKIVATLGPATTDPLVLNKIISNGANVVRLNLSHGTHDEHRIMVNNVREVAAATGQPVGVLVDLQGPKIRIGCFQNGPILLKQDDLFILDCACPLNCGTRKRVGLTYPDLIKDVIPGDILVLNDGTIDLIVEDIKGMEIICRVCTEGPLSDHKGINIKGGGLSAPALTDKDRVDIAFAAEIQADYLAVSFVRNKKDIESTRGLLVAAGGHGEIVAKIERAEALTCIEEIIVASQAIMIARGDLGVELGDAKLPAVQKQLIKKAQSMNRVVITATQMMETMITSPIPTRAEVFDVANAVIDGTDAVMLSGETSVGAYPAEAIEAMDRICLEAEKQTAVCQSSHRLNSVFGRIDEAIAMAAMYTANHLNVKAIAALSESGATPKWMSCINSAIPIIAITNRETTRGKVTLFRGVYPIDLDISGVDLESANAKIINELIQRKIVHRGETIIVTRGDIDHVSGGTNSMKILQI